MKYGRRSKRAKRRWLGDCFIGEREIASPAMRLVIFAAIALASIPAVVGPTAADTVETTDVEATVESVAAFEDAFTRLDRTAILQSTWHLCHLALVQHRRGLKPFELTAEGKIQSYKGAGGIYLRRSCHMIWGSDAPTMAESAARVAQWRKWTQVAE